MESGREREEEKEGSGGGGTGVDRPEEGVREGGSEGVRERVKE